jgi:hypothetical protein
MIENKRNAVKAGMDIIGSFKLLVQCGHGIFFIRGISPSASSGAEQAHFLSM